MNLDPFVLDHESNPHPRMLDGALRAKRNAMAESSDPRSLAGAYWRGYRDAMIRATGCTREDIEAWVSTHEARQ